MIIHVTKRHIRYGAPCNVRVCPIALALMDAGFSHPKAGLVSLNLGDDHIIPAPDNVREWMKEFDASGRGEPFSFEIEEGGQS